MTKASRWFIIINFILLLAGLYTGERIFFIGFGVSMCIMSYSLATCLWVLMDFNYTQSIKPRQVTKGTKAILQMEIHNDRLFIFPYIKVYYQNLYSGIYGTLEESICSVLPLKQHIIKEEIPCNIRGRFPLGIVKVEIGDLLGLFNFSIDLTKKSYHRPLYIDIWPRILRLASLPIPQIDHEGNVSKALMDTQDISNISDIRQYRFGDPLKKIHWKLSSKLQEIQVKNYESDTQPEIIIIIETSYNENRDMDSFLIEDQMIESTTAIVHYLLSNWISLELIGYTNARQSLTGKNPQDFQEFYGFLANLPFSSPFSIGDIMQMESHLLGNSNSGIFLVLKSLSPKLFNILFSIKDRGLPLLLFYVKNPGRSNKTEEQIMQEFSEKGINTIVVETNKRLDKILEAFQI